MKKLKFVEVNWLDAHSDAEWRSLDAVPTAIPCVTRGWLVKETDSYIVLAGTVMLRPDGSVEQVGELIAIPKGGFTQKIKRLKV